MELHARVRLIVDVPFEFDVGDNDDTGHNVDRVKAAKYAEKQLVDSLKINNGSIVDSMVEEVYEA